MICSDWILFQCVSILAVRMVKIAQVSERSPLDGAARQEWSRLAAQTLRPHRCRGAQPSGAFSPNQWVAAAGQAFGNRPIKLRNARRHAVAENFRER